MNAANLTIARHSRIEVPLEHQEEEGCVAFQMVTIGYVYFGQQASECFDTKIMANGYQFVQGGNGFVPHGFQIA